MADYQYSEVAGAVWTRCHRVVIENPPLGEGTPAVTFMESRVVEAAGERIVRDAGCVVEPFTTENAGEVFTVRHPETGDVIGTKTYAEIYAELHSLYLHIATKRDTTNQGEAQ